MKKILVLILLLLLSLAFCTDVFSIDYYVSNTSGDDENSGTDTETPWKSIAKVNKSDFRPSDRILFKRGDVWREQLTLKDSGTQGEPIYLGGYGIGDNPLIMCTNKFNDWRLAVDKNGVKVWVGGLDGVKNSWGAMRFGKRIPRYRGYTSSKEWGAPSTLTDMEDGFFYPVLNGGKFYIRNDSGNPGDVEIGSRRHGIYLENINYITIDGIDITGPGGDYTTGSNGDSKQFIAKYCDHVIIKNCNLSYGNTYSALIWTESTNCGYENIKAFGHMSTGLYIISAKKGNYIKNCEVFNCGNLVTDYGDEGGIGVLRTEGVVVEGCYVHDNGHKGMIDVDACISFVVSPYGTVSRCYVKNAAERAMAFAESPYCKISYNIIDTWGVYGDSVTEYPSSDGLRIGGGGSSTSMEGCKVLNNLFINGSDAPGGYAALRVIWNVAPNLEVRNNIFYNNRNVYDIYSQTTDDSGWIVTNNIFYGKEEDIINIKGKIYDSNHIIGDKNKYFLYDFKKMANNFLVDDPKLIFKNEKIILQADSPCIDNGVNVGLKTDYYGNIVPFGNYPDIGPFEFVDQENIKAPEGLIIE